MYSPILVIMPETGVYLTFTKGGKVRKIAGYTDLQSAGVKKSLVLEPGTS